MTRFCIYCGKATIQKASNLFVCANGHENWLDQAIAAVACIVQDGKLLFGVRSVPPNPGKLNLPGGFLGLEESMEEAVLREIKEELGVNIRIVDYIGSYPAHYMSKDKPVLNAVFLASISGGSLKPGDDMAGGQPVWRALDDLPTEDEIAWPWQTAIWPNLQRKVKENYLSK